MDEMQAIELLLEAYAGPTVVVGFLIIKGIAGILNNNISTKHWPSWVREPLDWLASADKKSKETSDLYVDSVVEVARKMKDKEASKVAKVLKLFS